MKKMQTKDDIRRKTRIIQIDQMLRGGAYVKIDSLVLLASGENNLHESGEINQKKSKEKSHYQF